uniref:Calponin-homology (CH) domain-containing protein n=1 Tax=Echeneis naucrates TaxID=173247 RepID=A0A665TV15_ECHNA
MLTNRDCDTRRAGNENGCGEDTSVTQSPCESLFLVLLLLIRKTTDIYVYMYIYIYIVISYFILYTFILSPPLTALTFSLPEENAERIMLDPTSRENLKFKDLLKVLIDWINSELEEDRIIVKDLEEDCYDGQVLQKLFEKLSGRKLNVAEVTQSEIGQKQKLQTVLEAVNELLRPHGWTIEWSVDSIHSKNLVAIIYLLVALAMHFQAPIRLPEHVSVQVVVVKVKCHIKPKHRDAFDTLLDHAPDKLNVVKTSLITFVNKHLNKLNLEVTELESQFADGVYLILLMGLLEDYFVPLYNFFLTPESFEQKVHNVAFAFELMQDGGLKKPKARPEDVVNLNLKSTLRVLYNLFTNYKNSE